MRDPVTCADGHSYERADIERWLATNSTSPRTGARLPNKTLTPNHALRNAVEEWLSANFKLVANSHPAAPQRSDSEVADQLQLDAAIAASLAEEPFPARASQAAAAAPPAPLLSRPACSPARGRPGSGFSVPVAAASASRAAPAVPATQLAQEQGALACAVLAVMCAVLLWGVSLTTHALTDYACTRFVLALAPYVILGEWWRKQRLCRAEAVQRAPPPPRSLAPLASPAPPPPRSLPPLASPAPPPPRSLPPLASPAPPPPRSLPPLASPGSREEREDAARRAVYLRRVPPEPLEGAANKTLLCVHAPAGSRVWRRFESSDTLEDLANFARSLSGVPLGSSLRLSNVTMAPHRPLNLDTQIGLSLYTLEMWPSAHVQVSDADAAPADAQR